MEDGERWFVKVATYAAVVGAMISALLLTALITLILIDYVRKYRKEMFKREEQEKPSEQ